MKNNKTLIFICFVWLFGEVAKWALGQWLTVNVTDGEITRIKVVLNVVLSYVAGSFGLGVIAGAVLISIMNWSVLPNVMKKIKSIFVTSNDSEARSTESLGGTTIYNLGGVGATGSGGGGGGGGAIGENSVGGSAGDGGDQYITVIPAELMSALHSGDLKMDVEVGEGGRSGKFPGEHGRDGGPSGIRFTSADGATSKFFGAAGGSGGKAGFIRPPGAIDLSEDDIDSGFRSTTLMLADALHIKNGLMYVMGGSINSYTVPSLPFDISAFMINVFSAGQLPDSSPRLLFYAIDDPSGVEVSFGSIVIPASESRGALSLCDWRNIEFIASVPGVWVIRVLSGSYELSRLPIEIKCEGYAA